MEDPEVKERVARAAVIVMEPVPATVTKKDSRIETETKTAIATGPVMVPDFPHGMALTALAMG